MDRKHLVASAQCFACYELASSSMRRLLTRNLINITGKNLKVQYNSS
jgi:hypothetical protein